ncbi:MAG TPA: ShlB/FhaC/HecB family hemolysin secretion/activation protein [Kiritimatiellia bacterium]|nr:ShlB/FhaC/HecB family hemolysin secretion/activation protein [Kiritimatiellia bacterium]
MLVLAGLMVVGSTPQGWADAASTARGRAQSELRRVESDTVDRTTSTVPRRSRPDRDLEDVLPAEAKPITDEATDGEPKPAPRRTPVREREIVSVDISGDAALLEETGLREGLEQTLIGQALSAEEIAAVIAGVNDALVDRGFYLAELTAEGRMPPRDGVVKLRVDGGRFGEVAILQRGTEDGTPYRGRFYRPEQIQRRLDSVQPGEFFDYSALYQGFYLLNAHPDLTADVDLRLRRDAATGGRIADVDVYVKDRLPLHGVVEIRNDGTDVTDEWQGALTLQYLNLTKRDDVLTLNVPVALDFESIRSVSAGYYLPHDLKKGGSFSLFGGYSELSNEDIVPSVGLEGDGWFVGIMYAQTLIANPRYSVEGSIGISHNSLKDALIINQVAQEEREVKTTPVTLGLNWRQHQPDPWSGFNSAYISLTLHSSSFPGASDDEEFDLQRENAKADYAIARVGVNRLQPLSPNLHQPESEWTVFAKLEGQISSEPLIPSEQKGIGGASTVRGYTEREFLGDHGVNGTLELRTPIYRGNVLPNLFSRGGADPERSGTFEGIQFVTFLDAAYVALEDNLAGENASHNLISAGLGFRISLGSHFQVKADWGFPLRETEDSESSGRGHISAQILF